MTILTRSSKSSKKEYLYAVFSSVLLSQVIAILYPEKISAEQVEEEKAAVRKLFGAHKMPLVIELAITAAFVAFAAYVLYTTLYSDSARSKGVSDGYFSAFPAGTTVGEVLDGFFANGKWENYEQDGVTFVHYSGECVSTQTGEKATVGIYFKLNNNSSFEIDRMTMDGETMNLLMQNIALSEISDSYCKDHGIASSNALEGSLDELENALDDAFADSSSSVRVAEPESETCTEDTDSDNSAKTATRSDRKVVSTNGMDTYSELSGKISVDVNHYEIGEMPEDVKEYYLSYGSDFDTAWLNALYLVIYDTVIHRSKSNRMIINCFLGFLIGRFDQRQHIFDLCPSNSLCRMEKSLQTAINPVSTFGMVFIRSNRSGFLYQGPAGILYLVL